jgi:threonine efflux protein
MLASLIAIAVLHWAVLVIPGFNFVLIGQLAAGGSRHAAMVAVAGMTSATLVWATLAVAGVGAVFTALPGVRLAVQIAGGLYLLHLALKLWRAGGAGAATPAPGSTAVLGHAAAFRAGFVTSMLNPKIALFYGSVFATALPANPPMLMVLLAVALVFANSVLWHGSLAWVLSNSAVQQAYLRHSRVLNRGSALLVGGYGARLIVSALSELRWRSS